MAEAATHARPYAKAAFMSARETNSLADWSKALQTASSMCGDARVAAALSDPKLSMEQIVSLFAGLGGAGIDMRWQNFVRILIENKRVHVLPEITGQFEVLKAQHENELDVEVTSASAMSDEQQAKMAASLKKRFKREVRITTTVDASLLGGAVIRAGDLIIDGSIKGRLQRLATELAS
jgi:F-type H+-transporting ATPase subunit delta